MQIIKNSDLKVIMINLKKNLLLVPCATISTPDTPGWNKIIGFFKAFVIKIYKGEVLLSRAKTDAKFHKKISINPQSPKHQNAKYII